MNNFLIRLEFIEAYDVRYIPKFTFLFTDTWFSKQYLFVSAPFSLHYVCVFFLANCTCFYEFDSLSLKYAISLINLCF